MSAEFTRTPLELMVEIEELKGGIERLKAELAVAHREISSLRHDAELTERQMELMLDSQRIDTEVRAMLRADRSALLRFIRAPHRLSDDDKARLAELGVNL